MRNLLRNPALPLILTLFLSPLAQAASFGDVEPDELFSPYIQSLRDQHLLSGDSMLGRETGTFRPWDSLNRAEMAKLATVVRLAEAYGQAEGWAGKSALQMEQLLAEHLGGHFNCSAGACQKIGGLPFADVPEGDPACLLQTEGYRGCQPWFSRFVYFAADSGFVKGYEGSAEQRVFRPNDPILRAHAFKMLLTDSGYVDPAQDPKFSLLESLAASRGSFQPKCLQGAELDLLALNGGVTEDSQRLLAYALLADLLDFFGSQCQLFEQQGLIYPQQRAQWLMQPLSRAEAARYFSLSSLYAPISPDPVADPTVNSLEENAMFLPPAEPEWPEEDPENPLPFPDPLAEAQDPVDPAQPQPLPEPFVPPPPEDGGRLEAQSAWDQAPGPIAFLPKGVKGCSAAGCWDFPAGTLVKSLGGKGSMGQISVLAEGYGSQPYALPCASGLCAGSAPAPQKAPLAAAPKASVPKTEFSLSSLVSKGLGSLTEGLGFLRSAQKQGVIAIPPSKVLEEEKGFFGKAKDWVTEPRRVEGIKQLGSGSWNMLVGGVQTAFGLGLTSTAVGAPVGATAVAFGTDNLGAGLGNIVSGFQNLFGDPKKAVVERNWSYMSQGINAVTKPGGLANTLLHGTKEIGNMVAGGAAVASLKIAQFAGQSLNTAKIAIIKGTGGAIASTIGQMVDDTLTGAASAATYAGKMISGFFSGVVSSPADSRMKKGIVGGIEGLIQETVSDITNSSEEINYLGAFSSGALASIGPEPSKFKNKLTGIGNQIITKLTNNTAKKMTGNTAAKAIVGDVVENYKKTALSTATSIVLDQTKTALQNASAKKTVKEKVGTFLQSLNPFSKKK